MSRMVRKLINMLPYVKNLHNQIKKQGEFSAGHHHSPIPSDEDVLSYIRSKESQQNEIDLPGIKLNKEHQFRLLQKYHRFYDELPFPEDQNKEFRYYYLNSWYGYADAIFLYSFLREHKPKKIVEVGSGFTSAVMLDTIDRFFSHRPEMTFIEPYPDRLKSLLKSEDLDQVRIIDYKLQDVPFEVLSSLESGDFLFIDSSHVIKCGSDVQVLIFDILPLLPTGIFVHFHDIFYPFEYPSRWLKEGRFWNENYFLRAFLSYNNDWSIYFFTSYIAFMFNDFIKDKMPLCTRKPGGCLYLKREKKG